MCENPGCGHTDTFFQDQNEKIEKYGYTYLGVLPDENGPGFIYTVGLSEKGKSDLIFIGSCSGAAMHYLAGGANAQVNGETLTPGIIEPETGINPYAVRMAIIHADHLAKTHAFQADRRLEAIKSIETCRVMQVIMPDMSNRFPWENGYDWVDQGVTENPFA